MPKLDGLFDDLEDETPTTLGQEIGNALTGALKSIGKSQEEQSKQTAQAIEAMAKQIAKAPPPQAPTVPTVSVPKPITEWVFDIERDEDGWLTRVIATAKEVG
jgi:hypothetical protein